MSEIFLRLLGFKAGEVVKYDNFRKLDDEKELVVENSYINDEQGIFKANVNYKFEKDVILNNEGFRSPPFPQKVEKQIPKSILLLGDSYTWGASAKPVTNSFADVIRSKGYIVYNTGIPGVATQQYAKIAEKFIPRLKPEKVLVMFFIGNDIVKNYPMIPNKPLYHVTNVGWMFSLDHNGKYMEALEAYRYHHSHQSLIEKNKNSMMSSLAWLNHSVLGSFLWVTLEKVVRKVKDQNDMKYAILDLKENLNHIKKLCEQNKCEFKLFLIPVKPEKRKIFNQRYSLETNRELFEPFNASIPDEKNYLSEDYLEHPDNHFNSGGHAKYAEYILDEIK